MAKTKIDLSSIDGYDKLSTEEKLKKLEEYEYEDHKEEQEKLEAEKKKLNEEMSKRNKEVADLKAKLDSKSTAEEKEKAAKEEELKKLQEELETMKKDSTIKDYKAQLLAAGYDEALATETAEAMAEGKHDVVLANQKKFLESHDKELEKKMLEGSPNPPAGSGTEAMTKEKLLAMSQNERIDWAMSHQAEYEKIYGNKPEGEN